MEVQGVKDEEFEAILGCTESGKQQVLHSKSFIKKGKKKTETKQANKTVLKTGNYESKATIQKHQNELPNAHSIKTLFLLALCYNCKVAEVTRGD